MHTSSHGGNMTVHHPIRPAVPPVSSSLKRRPHGLISTLQLPNPNRRAALPGAGEAPVCSWIVTPMVLPMPLIKR